MFHVILVPSAELDVRLTVNCCWNFGMVIVLSVYVFSSYTFFFGCILDAWILYFILFVY